MSCICGSLYICQCFLIELQSLLIPSKPCKSLSLFPIRRSKRTNLHIFLFFQGDTILYDLQGLLMLTNSIEMITQVI